MLDRLSHGDYPGALLTADAILYRDPSHRDAAQTRAMCRSELRKLYVARLGPLDRVPHVATGAGDLLRLQLDYRAGFVLSRVDGLSTLDEIATLDGGSSFTALRLLSELYLHRVIDFHEAAVPTLEHARLEGALATEAERASPQGKARERDEQERHAEADPCAPRRALHPIEESLSEVAHEEEWQCVPHERAPEMGREGDARDPEERVEQGGIQKMKRRTTTVLNARALSAWSYLRKRSGMTFTTQSRATKRANENPITLAAIVPAIVRAYAIGQRQINGAATTNTVPGTPNG